MSNLISSLYKTVKNWWLFLLAGILLIIVSAWVFSTPVESYINLAWLFSIIIFANGISNTAFSISNNKDLEGWGWYLVSGLLDIFIGAILLLYPEISIIILPFIIGIWLMFKGISIIGTSLDLKKYGVLDWGWIMLFGILIAISAFLMILDPLFGAINIVYLTSLSFLLYGIASIMLSLKLKKIKSKTIDVVDDLKKNVIIKADNLKNDILLHLKDVSKEAKDEITKKFNEYKNIIDNNTQK